MTDSVAQQAPDNQPFFGIQRVYLRGQSLELPQGAQVFVTQATPAMNLAVQVENKALAENIYEVAIRATLTAEHEGKTLYLLEVEQAGIFEARNLAPEILRDVLEIQAPAILAPYLRTQLSDSLTRATLPLFYLPEINWAAVATEQRTAAANGQPTTQLGGRSANDPVH